MERATVTHIEDLGRLEQPAAAEDDGVAEEGPVGAVAHLASFRGGQEAAPAAGGRRVGGRPPLAQRRCAPGALPCPAGGPGIQELFIMPLRNL